MKNINKFIAVGILATMAVSTLLFADTISAPGKLYGVTTNDSSMNEKLHSIELVGLPATRETVLTSTWKGNSARCEFWNKNGIQMYLNVNSNIQGAGYEFPNDISEIADYTNKMTAIADLYKPAWIIVENEELNSAYHEGDLFSDYVGLIKAATAAAHQKGYKISNGGITSRKIVCLTYRWLWRNNDSAADYFLQNCVPVTDTAWLSNYMSDKRQEENLSLNETLLRWYSSSDLDGINVHLYLPFRNRTKGELSLKGSGVAGLTYIITYLNSVLDGKKIISNETGFVENDTDLSYNTFRILDSAGIETCFYAGKGSKKIKRAGVLTKLGEGLKNYKP